LLKKADAKKGIFQTDPAKIQIWTSNALANPLALSGDVFIDFWAAIKDYQLGKTGVVSMFIRDLDPSNP